MAALIFLDRWTSIDASFPGFWYVSRNFHLALCTVFFVIGWWAHRNAGRQNSVKNATGPLFQTCRVFTKPECTLCDRALDVLQIYAEHLPRIELVNISGDAALEAEHGESIPVVEIDGRIRFRGIVSSELLQRLITARQQKNASHRNSPEANRLSVPGSPTS